MIHNHIGMREGVSAFRALHEPSLAWQPYSRTVGCFRGEKDRILISPINCGRSR